MSINVSENNCCGCGACEIVCPRKSIYLKENERGFLVPAVNKSTCIECGICETVCDYNHRSYLSFPIKAAYSVKSVDPDVLQSSTSGGAFTELSNAILELGGVIAGTVLGSDLNVSFTIADTQPKRDSMRGSVYVQSRLNDTYLVIKQLLSQNKIVLFIGTPCQIGGLLGFLKGRKDNLYTIEILCHGVPNQRMFKEHVELIEKRHNQKISTYSFRSKTFAWWTHGIAKAGVDNKKCISSYDVQSFLYFFQNNLSLRKSCFSCPYKDVKRGADITIGDDWDSAGAKKDYVNGLSLLTVNSPKGEFLFNLIKKHVCVSLIEVNRVNKTVSSVTHFPGKRYEEFWEMYCQSGYRGVENRFFPKDIKSITRFYIKRDKAQLESVWYRRRR